MLPVLPTDQANAQQEFRPGIDCHCRGPGGKDYDLKQRVCLRGPQGDRMATCVLNQNVTSWQFSDEPCDVSWRRADEPVQLATTGIHARPTYR